MAKKTYDVAVTGLACVRRVYPIKATSADEAQKLGLEKAKKDASGGNDHGWELNGLYDDGKPYSRLIVSEVTDAETGETLIEDV